MDKNSSISIEYIDDSRELTVAELCRICDVQRQFIEDMVHEAILEPQGKTPEHWCFSAISVTRVQKAKRLQHDLGVNLPGIALALDLLDELESHR